MRRINEIGIEIIKKFEGFSSAPYYCPAGYKTIGYGHVIRKNEDYCSLSVDEAENILKLDLKSAETAVMHYIRSDISDNQFSALVSLTYNIGGGSLQRSTLRQKINYISEEEDINKEFIKWSKVKGKIVLGLLKRRQMEIELFNSEI